MLYPLEELYFVLWETHEFGMPKGFLDLLYVSLIHDLEHIVWKVDVSVSFDRLFTRLFDLLECHSVAVFF